MWLLGQLIFLNFPQSHNTMFLISHHLTVHSCFLLASENVLSNGYSAIGFLQRCMIPIAEVSIYVMITRRILCSQEMLESFSPNEKLPREMCQNEHKKIICHKQSSFPREGQWKGQGCSCSTVKKAHATHEWSTCKSHRLPLFISPVQIRAYPL